MQPNPPARKRGSACTRCRAQKVRCDNAQPACSSCFKAGVECTKSKGSDAESKIYIEQLEKRTLWLEDVVRKVQPEAISNIDQQQVISHSLYQNEQQDSLATVHQARQQQDSLEASHPSGQQQIDTCAVYQNDQVTNPSNSQPVNHFLRPAHQGLAATSPAAESPAVSLSSQIGPSQPLAHDVGLLSLANSTEPKYLGPSSGVMFARLIFAAAPQSQGVSSSWIASDKGPSSHVNQSQAQTTAITFAELPPKDEMHYFVDAYFELLHPLYPFLNIESFQILIHNVESQQQSNSQPQPQTQERQIQDTQSQSIDSAQLFLVLALGAKALESRLSSDFSSSDYYSTAMFHVGKIPLHDSLRGVQVLLLLVLSSFSFSDGLNAWFLTSTIIASCLDLGLQRKHLESHLNHASPEQSNHALRAQQQRRGIFWSAYSLDRTLCVVLGRPLTLRDEAIDIEFPGENDGHEIDQNAVQDYTTPEEHRQKRQCLPKELSPYTAANYSFRFDRITAEIKLMIYRVAQSPSRFPWPTDLPAWQEQVRDSCKELLEDATQDLKWKRGTARRGLPDQTIHSIELKYHQCLMLLYRPSPAIPQPSLPALQACYDSALETIRIQSELHKFSNMINSWLTAHAVFVSGITMLYCLWTSPQIRRESNFHSFIRRSDACTKLLAALGKSWTVAESARVKFERLVQITADSWKQTRSGTITPANNQFQQQQQQNGTDMNDLTTMAEQGSFSQGLENLPLDMWGDYDADYNQGPNIIMDELGEMGSWFDLDWLGDTNASFPMEAYNIY